MSHAADGLFEFAMLGFSLEAPEGCRFLTRSRDFTDDEVAEFALADPATRGA